MTRYVRPATEVTRREFLTTTSYGFALTMLLQGCAESSEQAPSPTVAASTEVPPTATIVPTATMSDPAESLATPESETQAPSTATPDQQVSLHVKIGQMLMAGFRGLEASPDLPIMAEIRDLHLGGVVLFDYDVPLASPERNIRSSDQVRALIAGLQSAAAIPLLVAVDQEGGMVARLKAARGFPPTVSARSLGEANDAARTREAAGTMAQTLSDLGFNLNLAPVVDLDVNPANPVIGGLERSFSSDPDVVTAQAGTFIAAHHEHGMLCSLKHFPGHGSSAADSHLGLVDITNTWSAAELEPYAALVEAGAADAIMTAHVFHAKLDPAYPATLSKPIITGMLRDQLGFDGVVLCDDIQMGAIRTQYGFETAVEQAILAGVDMLIIANNTVYEEGIAGRAFAAIGAAVREGRIAEARIDESYRRVQALKGRVRPVG